MTAAELIKLLSDNMSPQQFMEEGVSEELMLGFIREIEHKRTTNEGSSSIYYFKKFNIYLCIEGYYDSYDNEHVFDDWSNCFEVFPRQEVVTIYYRENNINIDSLKSQSVAFKNSLVEFHKNLNEYLTNMKNPLEDRWELFVQIGKEGLLKGKARILDFLENMEEEGVEYNPEKEIETSIEITYENGNTAENFVRYLEGSEEGINAIKELFLYHKIWKITDI